MYSTFINTWFRFSKKMFLTDTSLCKADFILSKRYFIISNFYIMSPFQLNDPCIGRGPEKLSNAKYAFFCSLALYR